MVQNDAADAFADQPPLSSSDREFLFSLCPLQKDTREGEHRRPGLIINVISRGSVLS